MITIFFPTSVYIGIIEFRGVQHKNPLNSLPFGNFCWVGSWFFNIIPISCRISGNTRLTFVSQTTWRILLVFKCFLARDLRIDPCPAFFEKPPPYSPIDSQSCRFGCVLGLVACLLPGSCECSVLPAACFTFYDTKEPLQGRRLFEIMFMFLETAECHLVPGCWLDAACQASDCWFWCSSGFLALCVSALQLRSASPGAEEQQD